MWWMHDGWGMPWWWVIPGWIFTLAFWGAIIWLIVWAVRQVAGRPQSHSAHRSALDIAKERYARGEITREEFEEIKRTLQEM